MHSIAALSPPARVGATVLVDAIAIITVLETFVLWLKVHAHSGVTTDRLRTTVQTVVSIVSISIIALFAPLDDAIATSTALTVVTRVRGVVVAVVTVFAGADDAVATDIGKTIVSTGIIVDFVPIVASFVAVLLCFEPAAQDAIAASSEFAVVSTGVIVGAVAVVASFITLNDSIAAAGKLTGVCALIG
jgi:hypothetical protein